MPNDKAMQCDVKIGTSGYSYEDWREVFYPKELPKSNMLEFYCQHFNIVELNATYYTIPKISVFERLHQKTPKHFEFIVKVNRETTHIKRENEKAIKAMLESVKPLVDSGKFHGFLAQFPYSFKNDEKNRRYLVNTKKIIGDFPLFVEFRNYTWNNKLIPKFLEDNNISYVNVDEPNLKGLLPAQDWVTSDLGYIRFHGRNEKDWWGGTNISRYDYEYTPDELKEWLTNINTILKKTYKTYIFFNNHPTGKAIKNAKQMINILKITPNPAE
jgi:uncharacterized protein YecE (DUF72 family)